MEKSGEGMEEGRVPWRRWLRGAGGVLMVARIF